MYHVSDSSCIRNIQAYGLSREAYLFMTSYFQRRQFIFEWMTVRKGAAQGSILGPFIFNLFQNGLIVKLERTSDIYTYADVNTVTIGAAAKDLNGLKHVLNRECNIMLSWYDSNMMRENPSKFQYIVFGKSNVTTPIEINNGCVIHPTACVKVLGVHVGTLLTVHGHISYIIIQ